MLFVAPDVSKPWDFAPEPNKQRETREAHEWIKDAGPSEYWFCRKCRCSVKSYNRPPAFHEVATMDSQGAGFTGTCGEIQVLRVMDS